MSKRSIALVAVALLAMAACDDAPESGRTVVSISSFNQGAPVQSDVVVDNGTDPAYVAEDIIPATFVARPYNDLVTGTSHSQVVIRATTSCGRAPTAAPVPCRRATRRHRSTSPLAKTPTR